jgi:hypothetical protein
VRGCLPGLILLAACYAPAVPTGVKCSPKGECPMGQTCDAEICVIGGPVTPPDQDGDGLADSKDNCPAVANADQVNEDGDMFGDACDPCPQLVDVAVVDADGDQIGDACDPNAGTRDALWLFEGFHNGVPPWAAGASWTAVDDKVRVTAAGRPSPNDESIVPPLTHDGRTTFDNYAVTLSVVVDQLSTGTEHEIVIRMTDDTDKANIDCQLAELDGDHILWLVDDNILNQRRAVPWTSGAEYTLRMVRHGATYTCDLAGPGGPASVMGPSTVVPRNGASTNIRAYGLTAQLGWISIVGPAP